MKLSRLLESIEIIAKQNADKEIDIKKLAYHSTEVEAGTLFVCIQGFQTDGHDYAELAVTNGASALVVERFLPELPVPQVLVSDSRKALAVLSDCFYGHPSQSMGVFGVTGTNGKTTITYMTDAVFRAHELNTGMIGTIMVKYNSKKEPSVLTTPESLDLQRYLAEMREKHVSHVSMEVSSIALDLKRTEKVRFDVLAFTNIHRDHIDLHGSFEAYYNAKASFIRRAPKESVAILDIDEPLLDKLTGETDAQVVSFGAENTSGIFSVSDIDLSEGIPSFTVSQSRPIQTLSGETLHLDPFRIDLSVPGHYSISNAMTAIITGLVNDIPLSVVKDGIENFKGVERRFQIIYKDEFMIIDDLFLNEDNIDAGMKALKNLDYNKIHFVHAIRGSRGVEVNRENAERMADWFPQVGITKVTLTASRSHAGKLDTVTEEETAVFMKVMKDRGIAVAFHPELQDALSASLDRVEPGDILLITGAHGMDYGAKITLELLLETRPDVNEEAIREVLNNRMVGVKDLKVADVS